MKGGSSDAEFVVLTGPLGSGKTTLLVDYLSQAEAADTGVIVNEAGAVDVDGAILSTDAGGTTLARLPNGCICCSAGNDLHGAVASLMAERARATAEPLRRIILETSGLAHPGPILRSMAALPSPASKVRILATLDAVAGIPDEEFFPASAAQLAVAQAVVVTKAEVAGEVGVERARRDLAKMNPLVEPIVRLDRASRALAAFAPSISERRRLPAFFPAEAVAPHPRVRVLLAHWERRPDWQAVSAWLDELAFTAGDRLLRVKGLLDVTDCEETLLVESVGTAFGAPRRLREAIDGRRGVVVIVRDVELSDLRDLTGPGDPILEDTTAGAASGETFRPTHARQGAAPDGNQPREA